MPPLYRMPVFYVAVFAAVLLASVATWSYSTRSSAARPGKVSGRTADASIKPAAEVPGPSEPSASPDGILRTVDGLRRKVVIRDLDVVCRDEPQGGRPVGPRLDYFS